MCSNEKRRTRQAKIRVYREKIRAEGRAGHAAHKGEAGEGRRRRRLAQRLSQRWRRLQRRYGLSREDYETLLARQGGACGICKQARSRTACRRSQSRHRQGARPAVPKVQSRARLLRGGPALADEGGRLSGKSSARRLVVAR